MAHAMWMIIQDLHHQSPYAGKRESDKPKWRIHLHHKVCLWRLAQKLHATHQEDDSKPTIFSKPPMYHDFRRAILLPEFKDVVFHRMVDIGRCPRCQYIYWKCASVPLELRAVWQEAIAKHNQNPNCTNAVLCCRPGEGSQRVPKGPLACCDGLRQWA